MNDSLFTQLKISLTKNGLFSVMFGKITEKENKEINIKLQIVIISGGKTEVWAVRDRKIVSAGLFIKEDTHMHILEGR